MRFHYIECDVLCPHCGRMNTLSYASTGVRGDLYRCRACRGRAVHRRIDDGRNCALIPLREYGRFGEPQQCGAANPGRSRLFKPAPARSAIVNYPNQ